MQACRVNQSNYLKQTPTFHHLAYFPASIFFFDFALLSLTLTFLSPPRWVLSPLPLGLVDSALKHNRGMRQTRTLNSTTVA